MANNQLTIEFDECSPTPANGYHLFYKVLGDPGAYRDGGLHVSSPIVFVDSSDPDDTQYEGYIQSDCGDGILGNQIPFETTAPGDYTAFEGGFGDTEGAACASSHTFYIGPGHTVVEAGAVIYYDILPVLDPVGSGIVRDPGGLLWFVVGSTVTTPTGSSC